MGRTAGHFCSRESMYSLQIEPLPPAPCPLIHTSMEQTSDAMTWQQKTDFGDAAKANKRMPKGIRWKPLDLAAIPDPPVTSTIGDGATWSEQQAAFPIESIRRKPRGKAAAPSPLRHASQPPTETSFLNSGNDKDAQKPQIPGKRSSRKRRKNMRNGKMELPMSAYVPPHLRKRAATTAESKPTVSAANESSVASEMSRAGYAAKLHSSPNDQKRVGGMPLSPPTTPREPEHAVTKNAETEKPVAEEDRGAVWSGWDAPKPETTRAPTRRKNSNWPRGPKPPPKKTVWPKQSDMRAMPDSSSNGGVSFESNSNQDPDYDVKKLMDWNGDWLPPPEQWSARKGHSHRHFGQAMEQWMNGHGEDCVKPIDTSSPTFTEPGMCKEIVPKYWIVEKIENKSMGEFWKEMPRRAPSPLSDCELFADPPFWARYEDGTNFYLDALVVPEARIDPNDAKNNSAGSNTLCSANERIQGIHHARQKIHNRTLARQKRPLREPMLPVLRMEDRRIRPMSNVYFRPVQAADVRGIAEIYNHYVEKTIYANEFDGRTEQQIRNRVHDIVEAGLPYLVAIARGNQPKGPQGYVSEKIVGFINLDDYCDQSSMYRYTFELELYVHPGYLCQNIAKCLLDRLLEMANTSYNARGGYEYQNDSQYLKTGPSRVIKTILLTVHKEHGEDYTNTEKYLKAFNFRSAGHIPHVGYKLDKDVDAYLFRHTTSETINPSSIPTVPLERN